MKRCWKKLTHVNETVIDLDDILRARRKCQCQRAHLHYRTGFPAQLRQLKICAKAHRNEYRL